MIKKNALCSLINVLRIAHLYTGLFVSFFSFLSISMSDTEDPLLKDTLSLDLVNRTRDKLSELKIKRAQVSKDLYSIRQDLKELKKETDITAKETRKLSK